MSGRKRTTLGKALTQVGAPVTPDNSRAGKKKCHIARGTTTFVCKHGCGFFIRSPKKSCQKIFCSYCGGAHQIVVK